MQIISSCTLLSMVVLNILCTVAPKIRWNIIFDPPEVTAVPGLCALFLCNFTYPINAKPNKNLQWNACNKRSECKVTETEQIKWLEPDLMKNNCSIIIKEIKEDEIEYVFKTVGKNSTVKIIIQDEPTMEVPLLSEGQEANLTCSAPFPCPETPPEITWWIKTRGEKIVYLKDNIITLTTSKGFYLSALTLNTTSDLQNATVGCNVSYGSKNISTNRTLEVMYVKPPQILDNDKVTESDTQSDRNDTLNASTTISFTGHTNELNGSFSPGSENMPLNDTRNTTGIEDFIKNLDISKILTFVAGMACSAFIFSVVLCCWVCCCRGKKHKVPTANPDTEVNLETVQTDVAQTGTNEQTPLHAQLNGGNPNTDAPTDGAEEDEAVEMEAVDYASIDYSLLKDKPPEEGERESTDTDYAEIKRDRKGDGKNREVLQDGDDEIETPDQMEGEEEIYSNSQELS